MKRLFCVPERIIIYLQVPTSNLKIKVTFTSSTGACEAAEHSLHITSDSVGMSVDGLCITVACTLRYESQIFTEIYGVTLLLSF